MAVYSFRRPSEERLRAFREAQSQYELSYREVGQSAEGLPAGYDLDHNCVEIGRGREAFDAACAGLRSWRMFPHPWTTIWPGDAPIEVGNTVVMLVNVFGGWWLNACRIVYLVDEPGPPRRFGFAYGTLPGHVEQGEERFLIQWDDNDIVRYDLRAFSRPRLWLVRLGYPVARRLQRRFVLESQAAMRRIAGQSGSTPSDTGGGS